MRSTACAQLHALNCMLQKAVLSALVVCCGLLAKWLRARVRVRVRVRAGARECNKCTFFSLWFISVVNTSVFVGSVYSLHKCTRRVTYGYSIDDVTSWSWVNLAIPSRVYLASTLDVTHVIKCTRLSPSLAGRAWERGYPAITSG